MCWLALILALDLAFHRAQAKTGRICVDRWIEYATMSVEYATISPKAHNRWWWLKVGFYISPKAKTGKIGVGGWICNNCSGGWICNKIAVGTSPKGKTGWMWIGVGGWICNNCHDGWMCNKIAVGIWPKAKTCWIGVGGQLICMELSLNGVTMHL